MSTIVVKEKDIPVGTAVRFLGKPCQVCRSQIDGKDIFFDNSDSLYEFLDKNPGSKGCRFLSVNFIDRRDNAVKVMEVFYHYIDGEETWNSLIDVGRYKLSTGKNPGGKDGLDFIFYRDGDKPRWKAASPSPLTTEEIELIKKGMTDLSTLYKV